MIQYCDNFTCGIAVVFFNIFNTKHIISDILKPYIINFFFFLKTIHCKKYLCYSKS